MRFKTICIIILTVILTVICTQNTDVIIFTLLLWHIYVSKVIVVLTVALIGFILGLITGSTKRKKKNHIASAQGGNQGVAPNKLSAEDSDYISPT